MADFNAKYISTNIAANAKAYDSKIFTEFVKELGNADQGQLKGFEHAVLTAVLCGLKRANIVPALFHDLSEDKSNNEALKIFDDLKEALSIAFPFVGLPNCMPATLGLVGELKARGLQPPSHIRRSVTIYSTSSQLIPLIRAADHYSWTSTGLRKVTRHVGGFIMA
ncbi:hypothetical protein H2198_010020 [Neophaeococcomyces mojaviensis]|uniref:Uncharacterized protein n=1 Tax=Neophaeococcomyces mojaviensis TaxID=3383035 RepID=A0ACC2ZSU6_9EURO|nr:hypothetical protein H2198_010020 [Knufia sp. JES_112]